MLKIVERMFLYILGSFVKKKNVRSQCFLKASLLKMNGKLTPVSYEMIFLV